jgi:hypothetical protein
MIKKLFNIFCLLLLISNLLLNHNLNQQVIIIRNQDILIKKYENEIEELMNDTFSRKKMFQIAAEVYQIDFNLIYAIAKHETGHFKSKLFIENNNPGGIKDFYSESDWAKYDSEFEGIMEMARLLRNNYYDYGLNTLEKIGTKYCPNNPEWAKEVGSLIGQD